MVSAINLVGETNPLSLLPSLKNKARGFKIRILIQNPYSINPIKGN
jgi:hypothetical protein